MKRVQPPTTKEEMLKALEEVGFSPGRLAKKMKVSNVTIHQWMVNLDIKRVKKYE